MAAEGGLAGPVGHALGAAFSRAGAGMALDFPLHQPLCGKADHLAQKIRLGALYPADALTPLGGTRPNIELNQSGYGVDGTAFSLSDLSHEELWHARNQTCRSGSCVGRDSRQMINKVYITFSEVLAALLAVCAIGWIVKWGSSMLLIFLVGHHLGDDPSSWDLLRLISFYCGIVAGALFILWLLGRRRRIS